MHRQRFSSILRSASALAIGLSIGRAVNAGNAHAQAAAEPAPPPATPPPEAVASGSPLAEQQLEQIRKMVSAMPKLFEYDGYDGGAQASYYGGFMALGWASDDKSLRQTKVEALSERTGRLKDTKYYSPEGHQAAFQLPRFVAKLLN